MFSIIDNEINVNFEILGGSNPFAGVSGPQSPPAVSPPAQQSPAVSPPAQQSPAQQSPVQSGPGVNCDVVYRMLKTAGITDDNFKLMLADRGVALALGPCTDLDKFKNVSQSGGSLDDALIKDIQLNLIGGTGPEDAIFQAVLLSCANSGDPSIRALIKGMISGSSTAWLSGYSPLSLSGNNDTFPNITSRNVSGKLQVKHPVSGDFVSIDAYGETGLVAGQNYANAVQVKCFEAGEPMWKEDGSVKNPECVVAFKTKDLWKTSATDIAKMNPKNVFNILKSAGFKGEQTSHGIRCQTYDSWRKSLNETQKTALGMGPGPWANAQFFQNLVAFVNANPSILNKGDMHLQAPLDEYGVRAATFNKRVDHSFDDLRYRINSAYDTVRFRVHGLTGAWPSNLTMFSHKGGAPSFLFPSRSGNRVENLPKFSAQLRSIYKSMVARLRSRRKTLAQTTTDEIEKIFSSLEKHENEAIVLVTTLEKYYLSNGSNRDPAEISKYAMDKAVENFEKNMGKLRKRAINIVDIESVLNTAVRDAESAQSNFDSL